MDNDHTKSENIFAPLPGSPLEKLMSVLSHHEIHDQVVWGDGLPHILCSDTFAWGVADLEPIETLDDVDLLNQSCLDVGPIPIYGTDLYCARKRNMRPQGACYKCYNKEHWPLFDACGPVREIGFSNPVDPYAAVKQVS